MTVTIEKVTTHPVNSVYAPSRGNYLVTEEWIRCHSDQTATRERIDMDDIHAAIADTDFTENPTRGVYILKRWILIERNVEFDLRNTLLITDSVGNNNRGAGFQLKTFGDTKNEVLSGVNRSRLLTGNTRIHIENRSTSRDGIGPFLRNGDWRNEGGDTKIASFSTMRYDFSSSFDALAANGLDGQVEGHLSEWDFEQPWTVSILRLHTGSVVTHCLIQPTSQPAGLQILTAEAGGVADSPGAPQNNFRGGRFQDGKFSSSLTGVFDTVLLGRAQKSQAITTELLDAQLPQQSLNVNRRYIFFDICGASGSHTDRQTPITGITLSGHQSGMDGLFRLSHRWGPTFKAPDGAAMGVGLLDVILGTVSGGAADSLHNTGDNLAATINSDGTISCTDVFTQAIDSGTPRDHVRLPRFWTRNADAPANNLTVYSCDSATWQAFAAGYSVPVLPTALSYPFAGNDFGNFEEDIIIATDSVFGISTTEVTAVRTLLNDSLFAAGSGDSRQMYQLFCWLAEQETTALAARSLISTIGLAYAGVKVSFSTDLEFNVTTLPNGVAVDASDAAQVKVPAVAGQAYEASSIAFNAAIPDCTVDAPTITGTVDSSNPIDGLTLEQAASIDVALDADQTITVDNIRGNTLTISNTGSATSIGILTNTPDNVTAGTGTALLRQVEVSGMVAGGALAIYALASGTPTIAALYEISSAGTSQLFSGLAAGVDYRLAWAARGYEPIVMDIEDIQPGRRAVVLNPVVTPSASGNANPTGVTVSVDYTSSLIEFELDTVRDVDGSTVEHIDGETTNALFESAKTDLDFIRGIAVLNRTDFIKHTGLNYTSLRTGFHLVTGESTGICRHQVQALNVHDAGGSVDTALAVNVRQASVTINSETSQLPEVKIVPGVDAATYSDVSAIVDDAVAEIDLSIGAATVDGFTTDGENEMVGLIIAGS